MPLISKRIQRPYKRRFVEDFPKQHYIWTLEDKKALVSALKEHGFENKDKLAEIIGTKTSNEVEIFLEKWQRKMQRELKKEFCKNKDDDDADDAERLPLTLSDFAHNWAPIEFWSYATQMCIEPKNRSSDYSFLLKEIFTNIAEKESHAPAEEEDEPDLKKIYNYLSMLLSGHEGPQLSRIDSIVILHLIQELTFMIKYEPSWDDETNFMQSFAGPMKYVPIKKESKSESSTSSLENSSSSSSESDADDSTSPESGNKARNQTILPKKVYQQLTLHKKVQENLNPFSVPVPLLKKVQDIIKKYNKK